MKTNKKLIFIVFLVLLPVLTFAAKKETCDIPPEIQKLAEDLAADPELAKAIKQNTDLAKVWKDLEDSNETGLNNDPEVLNLLIGVPSIDNDFAGWFDKLTVQQVNTIWKNEALQKAIKNRLRHPGGLHEWCMVCRAPTFKEWGVTVDEIHAFRTKTKDLVWTHPDTGKPGGHDASAPGGKHGSTKFHNELKAIIDTSNSLSELNNRIQELMVRWDIDSSLLPKLK